MGTGNPELSTGAHLVGGDGGSGVVGGVMRITIEGDFNEIKALGKNLGSLLFGGLVDSAMAYADQAAASAARADTADRNALMRLEEIKKLKGEG